MSKVATILASAETPKKARPYRLKNIQVYTADAINQIKFTYDDAQTWVIGFEGGKADPTKLVFTSGEYLVKVRHEKYYNRMCAGAGVHFLTNKGREFSYTPRLATKRKSAETVVIAEPGHEIIALTIKRGVMFGVNQQPVPPWENVTHPHEWYTVLSLCPKEEKQDSDGLDVVTFSDWSSAKKHWKMKVDEVPLKDGRAMVLLDVIKNKIYKRQGGQKALKSCLSSAERVGLYASRKDETYNIFNVAAMVATGLNIGDKRDIILFLLTTFFILVSNYFDTISSLLTAHVLTSFSITDTTDLKELWVPRAICKYALECDNNSVNDMRTATILSFVIVKITVELLYVCNVYIHHNAGDLKNSKLRVAAFKRVMNLDQSFFDTKSGSDIRDSMRVHCLSNLVTHRIPYLMGRMTEMCFTLYFMCCISMKLTMICVFFLLVIKFCVLDLIRTYEKVMSKIESQLSSMNHQTMDEGLNMVSTIKLFSQEDTLVGEYQEAQSRYIKNINIRVVLRCIREFGYGILKIVSFSVAIFCSIQELKSGAISNGKLTAFFLFFGSTQGLIGDMKWRIEEIWRDMPHIQRFLDLMQVKSKVVSGPLKPTEVIGEISFKDVVFSYPSRPGDNVLKKLTMTLKPNTVTAIVGQSGAGKSTISKLLMRIYDPKSGSVSLDGINLKELDLSWFHEQVAIVNQNPALFNCSIRENIAYGAKRTVTDEEIFSAAKQANCYDFIMKFRGKFDTGAGSRGSRLSGGQKQRIAIARAIVCDPKILLLDEATSSLDSESERLVHEALDRLMEGRSTMVIAHRLSTIKNADTIIYMKDGKVLEQGTHDQLTQKKGSYYDLIHNQLL